MLLLEGKLTRESAALKYKDERIYDARVPEHLKKVLVTEETRNVCLFHRITEELDYVDKDLAIDMAEGFQTVGVHKKTGVWEVSPKKVHPKKAPTADFYSSFKQGDGLGMKPSWMEDYSIDGVLDLILEDMKLGRLIEITEAELVAPPMLAFGLDQVTKIRQIVDERTKSDYSALPEGIKLSGVRHIREAIIAFAAEPGTEKAVLAAASAQSTKGVFGRISAESEKRKAGYLTEATRARMRSPREAETALRGAAGICNAGLGWRAWGVGCLPHLATKDWKRAYFQVGTDRPEVNPVRVWDNKKGGWRIFLACVLNMGSLHSVPSW